MASEFKFTVWLPNGAVKVLPFQLDQDITSLVDSLFPTIEVADEAAPSLYKTSGIIQYSTDASQLQESIRKWWATNPEKLGEIATLREYFPDGPTGRQTKSIDLVLLNHYNYKHFAPRQKISVHGLAPRDSLVSELYNIAKDNWDRFFFVRGTPGSGKTTLCHLLYDRILQDEDTLVTIIGRWERKSTLEESFNTAKSFGDDVDPLGPPRSKTHWVLFDEAQTTYEDYFMWSVFLKDVHHRFRVVLFAPFIAEEKPAAVAGTQNHIQLHQQMVLRPTRNLLMHAAIPGLYFDQQELDLLVQQRIQDSSLVALEPDLVEWIYKVSSGHIGAIQSILDVASTSSTNQQLRTLSLQTFLAGFDDAEDVLNQCTAHEAFIRGLPDETAIRSPQNVAVIAFLRSLLELGPYTGYPHGARLAAHHLGWVTTHEEQTASYRTDITVDFPSPLHRARASWLLLEKEKGPLPVEIHSMTLIQFVEATVRQFSRNALLHPVQHVLHPRTPSPTLTPDAKYEREFYRRASQLTAGRAPYFSPDFGMPTSAGRVDLLVANKWGIEILREGDRNTPEHLKRFEIGGAPHAHPWLASGLISELVVLDFGLSIAAAAREAYPGAHARRNVSLISMT
ncbi:hypothetical protein B0H16DRAFT_147767 [Mycena metata]|uniref:Uncharacterized protein n=1 Tax=Mycena metata TaxID=1033252 RepID=A0AAD7JWP5_9AGAR|nr:hypothetical protein B0H16DRAFT_147767 [Mycena metata]